MENENKPFRIKGTITAMWILAAVIIIANIMGMLHSCSGNSQSGKFVSNTWYEYSGLDCLQYKNCRVANAIATSGGKNVMVKYYPVCSHCGNVEKEFSLTSVSTNEPLTKFEYCSECMSQTAVSFRVVS